MRKVRLALDDLQVDSFHTSPRMDAGRGTVRGQGQGTVIEPASYPRCASYPQCASPLCVDTPLASCDDASCRVTCGDSCNGTCQSCASCQSCVSCNSCQESCLGSCSLCIPPDQIGHY